MLGSLVVRHAHFDRLNVHLLHAEFVPKLTFFLGATVGQHMTAQRLVRQDFPVLGNTETLFHGFLRLNFRHKDPYSVFAGAALELAGFVDKAGTTSFFFTTAIRVR